MSPDWSSHGVDWRDATKDEAMAREWLRNERLWTRDIRRPSGVPPGYDLDLEARVSQLVQTELDRERGWRLVLTLLRIAEDERDLANVATGPLETFVDNHGDAFYDQIDERAGSNPDFRHAIDRTLQGWPGSHKSQERAR